MTPYVLLLAAIIALIIPDETKSKKVLLWLLLSYCATVMLEITGVNTGLIFGDYRYGEVLGNKIAGVPFIIGLNWVLLIVGAFCISNEFSRNKFFICLNTALMLILFDFLLEPVAMKLGYWSWSNNIIPLQNYFAWFAISILAALSLIYFDIKIQNKIFIHYYVSMSMFFFILNFK